MINDTIKLQKFMAEAGIASRRKAEEQIKAGKVTVNGKLAKIGDRVDPKKDKITYLEKPIQISSKENVYIMMNKPREYLTTVSDDRGRKTVMELLTGVEDRVFPVGRLDYNSEGMLILTNDGDFAYAMTHPSHELSKTYEVSVAGNVTDTQLKRLNESFVIEGKKTKPANVEVLEKRETRTKLIIKISEGRNRQIRRMCEQVGLDVRRLKRIAIGDVLLERLNVGKWRFMTKKEVELLLESSEKTAKGDKND